MFQHLFQINDRVIRKGAFDTFKIGTIVECLPGSDVYYVAFDDIWGHEPILCTAQVLRNTSSQE